MWTRNEIDRRQSRSPRSRDVPGRRLRRETALVVAALLGGLFVDSPALAAATPEASARHGREPVARPLTFTLDLVLEPGPDFAHGLGAAIVFEGRELEFEGFDGLEAKGLVGSSRNVEADEDDVDGDARTNRVVRAAWVLPGGGWEKPGKSISLGRAVFRQVAPQPPRRWPDDPVVAVVSLSADRKGWFPDVAVRLVSASQTARIAAPPKPRKISGLTATADEPGSTRPFVLGRFQAHRPLALESERLLAATLLPCNLDVDGNGVRDALTDGLLVHRHLFGFTGTALVSDALGTGATRTDGAAVAAFLSQQDCAPMLDVDANGSTDALTDGLLTLRFLFGFTGKALSSGATAQGAKRNTGSAVAQHLDFCDNPREVLIQKDLSQGESAADAWEDVRVKATGGPTSVTVIRGTSDDGAPTIVMRAEPPVKLGVTLPPPGTAQWSQAGSGTVAGRAGSPPWKVWGDPVDAWFAGRQLFVLQRMPAAWSTQSEIETCISGTMADSAQASRLRSGCSPTDSGCYEGKEAVIFVHGYALGGGLGDGPGTFGTFPDRLSDLGYVRFVFEWDTRARFEDVAVDLGTAIETISAKTGRKVHVVGHSMGGVLARTLLQGFATLPRTSARDLVRTLTTLGTPHSGIADATACLNGVALPTGQETEYFLEDMEFCGQLSCHQLGEDVLDDNCEPAFYGVEVGPGGIAARLATLKEDLPDVDILTLIGWTIYDQPNKFANGDELISYWGQRFFPDLTVGGGCPSPSLLDPPAPLLTAALAGGARITERGLFVSNPVPNAFTGLGCTSPWYWPGWHECDAWDKGYTHSFGLANTRDPERAEAWLDCSSVEACDHHSFVNTREWLEGHPAESTAPPEGFLVYLRVLDPDSGLPVAGATVVDDATNSIFTTGADGRATLSLLLRPGATYTLTISHAGYRSVLATFTTATTVAIIDLGDRYLGSEAHGYSSLGGSVTTSGGIPVPGASYTLRRTDHAVADRQGVTSITGTYSEIGLLVGTYVVTFSKSGLQQTQIERLVRPGEAANGDATMTPEPEPGEITVNLPNLPAGAKPLVLVRIPAGTFQMGAPSTELHSESDERPVHQVTLTQDYYMGKYEVTQAQWKAVMGVADDCTDYAEGDDYPVACASWYKLVGPGGFFEKLRSLTGDPRFRLSTEAEWERAARGGTQTRFSFGDALDNNDDCGPSAAANPYMWWCGNNGPYGAKPVGTKLPNQFGLHDLHGNVWEWVYEAYGGYSSEAQTDPTGLPPGYSGVIRGGSWINNLRAARSAQRTSATVTLGLDTYGFRVTRSR